MVLWFILPLFLSNPPPVLQGSCFLPPYSVEKEECFLTDFSLQSLFRFRRHEGTRLIEGKLGTCVCVYVCVCLFRTSSNLIIEEIQIYVKSFLFTKKSWATLPRALIVALTLLFWAYIGSHTSQFVKTEIFLTRWIAQIFMVPRARTLLTLVISWLFYLVPPAGQVVLTRLTHKLDCNKTLCRHPWLPDNVFYWAKRSLDLWFWLTCLDDYWMVGHELSILFFYNQIPFLTC